MEDLCDAQQWVGFAGIGGSTAEEVNYAPVGDLMDTIQIENFGWGRNADGLARESTFYVDPGLPLAEGIEPPPVGVAPIPEPGFIQPQAQYGRSDPNAGDPRGTLQFPALSLLLDRFINSLRSSPT